MILLQKNIIIIIIIIIHQISGHSVFSQAQILTTLESGNAGSTCLECQPQFLSVKFRHWGLCSCHNSQRPCCPFQFLSHLKNYLEQSDISHENHSLLISSLEQIWLQHLGSLGYMGQIRGGINVIELHQITPSGTLKPLVDTP